MRTSIWENVETNYECFVVSFGFIHRLSIESSVSCGYDKYAPIVVYRFVRAPRTNVLTKRW